MRLVRSDAIDVAYRTLRDGCSLGELVQFHILCDLDEYKSLKQRDKIKDKVDHASQSNPSV